MSDAHHPAQDRDYLEGQLLVAMPNMPDARFAQSVILICAHTDEHAMGVILNRILNDVTFGSLTSELGLEAAPEAAAKPVLYGGPVDTDRGLVVHTLDYRAEQTIPITPEIGITGSRRILEDIADPQKSGPRQAFLALGYAGWGAGQLESEIGANAWLHCAARPDIVFDEDFEGKWRRALGSLGVTDAMFGPEWSDTRDGGEPIH